MILVADASCWSLRPENKQPLESSFTHICAGQGGVRGCCLPWSPKPMGLRTHPGAVNTRLPKLGDAI